MYLLSWKKQQHYVLKKRNNYVLWCSLDEVITCLLRSVLERRQSKCRDRDVISFQQAVCACVRDRQNATQTEADRHQIAARYSPDFIGCSHGDVIKWPFVRGIHRSPVDSHHKGQ